MSSLQAIRYLEFEAVPVRVIDREENPWFMLADVCRVLEVGNPSDAAKRLDANEKMTLDTIEGHSGQRGGAQFFTVINESGLYSMILTSRKAAAKRFKQWVTGQVLPMIRRTGRYEAEPVPALSDDDVIAKAMLLAGARMKRLEERASVAEGKVATLLPMAEAHLGWKRRPVAFA
jgi:prophage antirepressor-like protein